MRKCQPCISWIKSIPDREKKPVQWAYSRKGVGVFKEKKVWLQHRDGEGEYSQNKWGPNSPGKKLQHGHVKGRPAKGFKPKSSKIHFTFCKDHSAKKKERKRGKKKKERKKRKRERALAPVTRLEHCPLTKRLRVQFPVRAHT